jgi:hypothetical protein
MLNNAKSSTTSFLQVIAVGRERRGERGERKERGGERREERGKRKEERGEQR